MTVVPSGKDKLGRKAAKKRSIEVLRVKGVSTFPVEWHRIDIIRSVDLTEVIQSLGLTLKLDIDIDYFAEQLSLETLAACNLACVEAALESNALLAKRYHEIADDISAALKKLHYPPISEEPGELLRLEHTRTSVAVEYLKPILSEIYGFDGAPMKEVSVPLASIGTAARKLALSIEKKTMDLAERQWQDFHPGIVGQSKAQVRYTASDTLLFWFLFAFVTSFQEHALLKKTDGTPNEESVALAWCKSLLNICVRRTQMCLMTPSPDISRMLTSITQTTSTEKAPKVKKATSLAARLSEIHAWVQRARKEASETTE